MLDDPLLENGSRFSSTRLGLDWASIEVDFKISGGTAINVDVYASIGRAFLVEEIEEEDEDGVPAFKIKAEDFFLIGCRGAELDVVFV